MKVKIQALFLYMALLCLLISIEIHQINSELENWISQPPLKPFEDNDENYSTPGSMSEVPNKINENVAPTKISVPEGYAEYQASSNAKISTPTKSVKVTSEKPGDRSSEEANSIEITSRPVTTQVFGDDMSTRESYATKLEMDGNIFEEMGSGSIPDDSNENASTVVVTEDNITATAHDLSTSEVVLLIGVSFASFLLYSSLSFYNPGNHACGGSEVHMCACHDCHIIISLIH